MSKEIMNLKLDMCSKCLSKRSCTMTPKLDCWNFTEPLKMKPLKGEMMNIKILLEMALPKIFENIIPEGHYFLCYNENTDLKIFIDIPTEEDCFYVITFSKRSAIDGARIF